MALRKAVLGVACLLVSGATVSAQIIGQSAQVSTIIDRPCDFVWRHVGTAPVTLLSSYFGGAPSGVVRGTGSGKGNKVGNQLFVDLYGFRFTYIVAERNDSDYTLAVVQLSSNEIFRTWRDEFSLTSFGVGASCRVDHLALAHTAFYIDVAGTAEQGLENLKASIEGLP